MNKKIRLASNSTCTGCGACAASCAHSAITVDYDKNGFLRPTVDYEKCIGCGLCTKTCPVLNNNRILFHSEKESSCYSAWTKDDELCRQCTSGGVFSQIAIDFLSEPDNYVYGAYLGDNNNCYHIEVKDVSELYKIRGTKYIQSNTTAAIKQAKERLSKGARVLFSGTPCQIAGVYSAIPKKLQERLFTVEVLCHGTPSKLMSDFVCRYYGAEQVISYRDKDEGWQKGIKISMRTTNGYKVKDSNHFFLSAADNLSCYSCNYSKPSRIADLSLGDQWGGKERYLKRTEFGMNLVLANSHKGSLLLKDKNIERILERESDINNYAMFASNMLQRYACFSRHLYILRHLPDSILYSSLRYNWKYNIFTLPKAIIKKIAVVLYKKNVHKNINKYHKNLFAKNDI